MKNVFLISMVTLAIMLGTAGESVSSSNTWKTETVKITIGEKILIATMADNITAREFMALLPFTMTLNDYAGREKYGHCAKPLSEGPEGRQKTYKTGDIGYWSPNTDFAIFYRHDGTEMPDPGITMIGTISSGIEAFNVEGQVTVTFEVIP